MTKRRAKLHAEQRVTLLREVQVFVGLRMRVDPLVAMTRMPWIVAEMHVAAMRGERPR